MRTKTLLLTAALSAAGIATSMAQAVYSVNAVGYVNTTLVPGFNLVSNPLDNKAQNGNTIASLFAGLPVGTQVYKFNGTSYTTATMDEFTGTYEPVAAGNTTVVPGEGVFVSLPAGGNRTVTFVGEVPQGTLTTDIPQGFSIRSSKVPQAGTATALGFPAAEGDQIFIFNEATQAYVTSNYSFGAWDKEPDIQVGDAFFVRVDVAANWTRTFNVNQ
jgi:hypothetical protein